MTKSELVAKVSAEAGITKTQAEAAITAFTSSIVSAVNSGDKISLPNFGTFKLKETAAKVGRNPKTGETIPIPASKKLSFKPTKH